MPLHTVSFPESPSRTDPPDEPQRVLARFPLLLRILKELQQSTIPLPGDDDIRHGCDRALTAMLSELARVSLQPHALSPRSGESLRAMLSQPIASGLVDADKLERMQSLIESILQRAEPDR